MNTEFGVPEHTTLYIYTAWQAIQGHPSFQIDGSVQRSLSLDPMEFLRQGLMHEKLTHLKHPPEVSAETSILGVNLSFQWGKSVQSFVDGVMYSKAISFHEVQAEISKDRPIQSLRMTRGPACQSHFRTVGHIPKRLWAYGCGPSQQRAL